MSRPPPPPSATHSSFNCPNSSPADNISTAADVNAVAAAEALKKKAEEMLARRQVSLQIKKAWLSSRRTAKDEKCLVMDFSQNGEVPGLKEQPGPTSTYYYNTSTYYYYPSGHGKNCSGSIKKSSS